MCVDWITDYRSRAAFPVVVWILGCGTVGVEETYSKSGRLIAYCSGSREAVSDCDFVPDVGDRLAGKDAMKTAP